MSDGGRSDSTTDQPDHISVLDHFTTLLNEMDLRYQQRYDAQTKALEAALLAADKAVQAALLAAEKAVIKAETAAERRFESVNEFRGQLGDQAKTFMPRAEYIVQHQSLSDKVDVIAKTLSDRIDVNTKSINDSILSLNLYRADAQGRTAAGGDARVESRWSTGMLVMIAASLVAATISILSLILHH